MPSGHKKGTKNINSRRSSESATNKRQERKSSTSEEQRPDPPPPPPASLVRLLKRDSAVLQYFQSLQSNLDYDVKKWKTRARASQEESSNLRDELQRLQEQQRNPPGEPVTGRYAKKPPPPTTRLEDNDKLQVPSVIQTDSNGANLNDNPMEHSPEGTPLQTPESQVSPTAKRIRPNESDARAPADMDFDLELSSSEDEEENGAPMTSFGIHKKNKDSSLDLSSSSSEEMDIESDQQPLERLNGNQAMEQDGSVQQLGLAMRLLEELGISLVDEVVTPLPREEMQEDTVAQSELPHSQSEDGSPATDVTYKRRPDEDVITDMLHVIKALCHVNVESKHSNSMYGPFMTNTLHPCYTPSTSTPSEDDSADVPHPAVHGLEVLITSLCLMDIYGQHFDSDFSGMKFLVKQAEEPNKSRVSVGMKGRKRMVEALLSSLSGEITELWPSHDRTTRLEMSATHFTAIQPDQRPTEPDSQREKADSPSGCQELYRPRNVHRLSALVERCMLARIIVSLYLCRQDYQSASHCCWEYLVATTPSVALEDHPKLVPVQSFCVLEALLLVRPPRVFGRSTALSSGVSLLEWFERNQLPTSHSMVQRILHLAFQTTAGIYAQRNGPGVDDRISSVSRVELAAYDRIQNHGSKMFGDASASTIQLQDMAEQAKAYVEELMGDTSLGHGRDSKQLSFPSAQTLALVLVGDSTLVDKLIEGALAPVDSRPVGQPLSLLACVRSKRQLEIRQLDRHRQTTMSAASRTAFRNTSVLSIQSTSTNIARRVGQLKANSAKDLATLNMLQLALQCCVELADCEGALEVCRRILLERSMEHDNRWSAVFDWMNLIESSVTVRVINLKRRPDRWAALSSQALRERLLLVRGVVDMKLPEASDSSLTGFCHGQHAFDGGGRAAEVEQYLIDETAVNLEGLSKLVQPHWSPAELRPFDVDAPTDSELLVPISPSEKACTLSHIASWRGVVRCLSPSPASKDEEWPTNHPLFRSPQLTYQRLHIAGYASGPALFPSDDRDPTPVCVILEDDAVLVDRFSDRLRSLLQELPRDFHFCSLGYSRPKTAPLVPYSKHVGIPTSIWYLTGYVMSLEGARYLLDKRLPVRGPVDSWIGLAMFSNWDNVFGHAMGVGVHAKPNKDPNVAKEDLRKLLRFRAFAAMVPLCHQKVGLSTSVRAAKRSWRQKDTDITYSGNLV